MFRFDPAHTLSKPIRAARNSFACPRKRCETTIWKFIIVLNFQILDLPKIRQIFTQIIIYWYCIYLVKFRLVSSIRWIACNGDGLDSDVCMVLLYVVLLTITLIILLCIFLSHFHMWMDARASSLHKDAVPCLVLLHCVRAGSFDWNRCTCHLSSKRETLALWSAGPIEASVSSTLQPLNASTTLMLSK